MKKYIKLLAFGSLSMNAVCQIPLFGAATQVVSPMNPMQSALFGVPGGIPGKGAPVVDPENAELLRRIQELEMQLGNKEVQTHELEEQVRHLERGYTMTDSEGERIIYRDRVVKEEAPSEGFENEDAILNPEVNPVQSIQRLTGARPSEETEKKDSPEEEQILSSRLPSGNIAQEGQREVPKSDETVSREVVESLQEKLQEERQRRLRSFGGGLGGVSEQIGAKEEELRKINEDISRLTALMGQSGNSAEVQQNLDLLKARREGVVVELEGLRKLVTHGIQKQEENITLSKANQELVQEAQRLQEENKGLKSASAVKSVDQVDSVTREPDQSILSPTSSIPTPPPFPTNIPTPPPLPPTSSIPPPPPLPNISKNISKKSSTKPKSTNPLQSNAPDFTAELKKKLGRGIKLNSIVSDKKGMKTDELNDTQSTSQESTEAKMQRIENFLAEQKKKKLEEAEQQREQQDRLRGIRNFKRTETTDGTTTPSDQDAQEEVVDTDAIVRTMKEDIEGLVAEYAKLDESQRKYVWDVFAQWHQSFNRQRNTKAVSNVQSTLSVITNSTQLLQLFYVLLENAKTDATSKETSVELLSGSSKAKNEDIDRLVALNIVFPTKFETRLKTWVEQGIKNVQMRARGGHKYKDKQSAIDQAILSAAENGYGLYWKDFSKDVATTTPSSNTQPKPIEAQKPKTPPTSMTTNQLRAEFQKKDQEVVTLSEKVKGLEQGKQQSEQEAKAAKEQLAIAQQEKNQVEQKYSEISQQLVLAANEVTAIRQRHQQLENANHQLKQRIAQLEVQLQQRPTSGWQEDTKQLTDVSQQVIESGSIPLPPPLLPPPPPLLPPPPPTSNIQSSPPKTSPQVAQTQLPQMSMQEQIQAMAGKPKKQNISSFDGNTFKAAILDMINQSKGVVTQEAIKRLKVEFDKKGVKNYKSFVKDAKGPFVLFAEAVLASSTDDQQEYVKRCEKQSKGLGNKIMIQYVSKALKQARLEDEGVVEFTTLITQAIGLDPLFKLSTIEQILKTRVDRNEDLKEDEAESEDEDDDDEW